MTVSQPLQQHYLQAMGIVNWQLRANSSEQPSCLPCVRIQLNPNTAYSALILADLSMQPELQLKETVLLSAICRAIVGAGGAYGQMELMTDTDVVLPDDDFTGNSVILLGEKVGRHYLDDGNSQQTFESLCGQLISQQGRQYLLSYSLSALLQQPLRKAELWQQLQPICQRLIPAIK